MLRKTKSTPVVDELFEYLDKLWFEKVVDRATRLGKAIAYTRDREVQLRAYLEHPDIPISNNHVERAIRPLKLGAKNWLFCWTEVGAKYTAIAYTLIECCKMHRVDTWKYFHDVLQRIDTHPARDVYQLTPKHWKHHFGK